MSKIYFKHGTMTSGKTLDLLRVWYNYEEKGLNVLTFKPIVDTREGTDECMITTRAGLSRPANWIEKDSAANVMITMLKTISKGKVDVIIIDEAQFLNTKQIDYIQKICYRFDIPVIFYGIKNNFLGELFEGSKRILEIADSVEEFKCMCKCGRPAKQNAKIIDGKIMREGAVIDVGGNEKYEALCNHCFYGKGENDGTKN